VDEIRRSLDKVPGDQEFLILLMLLRFSAEKPFAPLPSARADAAVRATICRCR
jgi:hypothetical protein